MYIAPGQGKTAPRGHSFDVNFVISFICCKFQKKCLRSLILNIFFHDLIHVYNPGAGADTPGNKILMSTKRPYHFTHLLQVSKKSL